MPLFSGSRTLQGPISSLDGTEEGKEGRGWKYIETKKKKKKRERMKQCQVGHTFVVKSKPNPSVCVRWNYLILLACESL